MPGPTFRVQASSIDELLLSQKICFQVPLYQRAFAWNAEQVEELLDDLYEFDAPRAERYFLGSLVFAGDGDALVVLDGQQRLTTISLLLAVFAGMLERAGSLAAGDLRRYLFGGRFGEPEIPKLRLQEEDRPVYEALLRAPLDAKATDLKTRLGKAVSRIRDRLSKLVEDSKHPESQTLVRAAKRLLDDVEVVRIEAPTEVEAFRLFETLNDRGLDLSAADLIKNKLFAQAGARLGPELKLLWERITDALNTNAGELGNFLRHYWIAFHAPVRKDQLFAAYSSHIATLGETGVLAFVRELVDGAESYQAIANPNASSSWDDESHETLEVLQALRARSCRPLLMVVAKRWPESFSWVARACEVASIRHTLVGEGNPNQLDRVYSTLCRELAVDTVDVRATIESRLGPAIPDGAAFVEAFSSTSVGTVTSSWRAVLERLNDALSSGEARVRGPRTVQVEHVLPQSPSPAALLEAGLSNEQARELCGRIGNLTLLLGKRNQSVSNGPFSAKRDVLGASDLPINRDFRDAGAWGPVQITERSRSLAALAERVWPWPIEGNGVVAPAAVQGGKKQDPSLRPMGYPRSSTYLGTVQVPRILWALEWAQRAGEAGVTASRISEILEEHAGMSVPSPNISRALRDLRNNPDAQKLWVEVRPLAFQITEQGTAVLRRVVG